jgi:NAD/NADP transhydrogenase alpha subunit
MDTLSSMASIAGYKGVLLAADALNKYFPMLTTAAGMVFPAKVFVIGAAVAGPASDCDRPAASAPTSSRPTCGPR